MTQYPKQTNDGLPTEERILWISGALGLLVAFLLTAAVVFATVGTGTLTTGYVPVALVFTAAFPRRLGAHPLVTERADLPAALAQTTDHRRVAFARPSAKSGRVAGIAPELVAPCHRRGAFDLTLVKADGARARLVKSPRADEPVVPACAERTLLIASIHALARPLDEGIAHRLDEVLAITGLNKGDWLTPATLARLFTDPRGLSRGVGASQPVPVLHMVDTAAEREHAEMTARLILEHGPAFDRVVLTSNRAPGLLVTTIARARGNGG